MVLIDLFVNLSVNFIDKKMMSMIFSGNGNLRGSLLGGSKQIVVRPVETSSSIPTLPSPPAQLQGFGGMFSRIQNAGKCNSCGGAV